MQQKACLFAFLGALAIGFGNAKPAAAQDTAGLCAQAPLISIAAGSSQIPLACTVPAGKVLIESSYYQNASTVGGTALAAYPLPQITAGLWRGINFVFDPPTQIAESGPRGKGLYPRSHSGYGLRYGASDGDRLAFAFGFTGVPPASLYAPTETQPKYVFDITTGYRLTSAITLKGIAAESTSHTAGFGRVLPAEAFGADVALSSSTAVSTDVGMRSVARRTRGQEFTDLSVKRAFSHKLVFDVGVGTAFNSVAASKAHYLATGLTFRP